MNAMSPRNAFTLVELLVVIVLISVLTGMMSYALAGARQDARIKRAEAEIALISSVLQFRMNEINMQPVSFVPPFETSPGAPSSAIAPGIEANRVAMLARRDLLRMTLPQCRADLIYPPARLQYRKRETASSARPCAAKVRQPSEWGAMRRLAGFQFYTGSMVELRPGVPQIFSLAGADPIGGATGYYGPTSGNAVRAALGSIRQQATGSLGVIDLADATTQPWGPDLSADDSGIWTRRFESAECLYLILATTEIYGQRAIDLLGERSIANLDNDNVPEIVDPWGVPYEFIRDATGFSFPFFGKTVAYSTNTTNLPDTLHPSGADANDYLRTDFRYNSLVAGAHSYRLAPIVVSAGVDGVFGIRRTFDRFGAVANGTAGISPRQSIGFLTLDPASVASAGFGPVLPGTYQYPDPYLSVASEHPAFQVSFATLEERAVSGWFRGAGLGARFHDGTNFLSDAEQAASDNVQPAGPSR